MTQLFTLVFVVVCLPLVAFAQDTIRITDADLVGNTTYNWTASSDTVYLLDGLVFLEAGGVLNIEAGTVVRARESDVNSATGIATALVIARDAQIFAEGTAEAPVLFVPESYDPSDAAGLPTNAKGLWGGLIVLGNAPIAFSNPENGIEGIVSSEERARYGGDNPDDNSGVLRYVSIRHGGYALSAGNEINGLTLGAVGSGTEIDYIEVFANLDDGIEFFGGTVRVDHAVVSYCADDGMDYDLGWRGGGQYWFVLQGAGDPQGTGRGGEHDGADPDGQMPFSQPTIYNATYVGIGNGQVADDGDASDASSYAILFRDNAGGYYNNSIFTDYNDAAIAIEQRDDDTPDSYDRLVAGDLALRNNIFFNFGAGGEAADLFVAVDASDALPITGAASQTVVDSFTANNNQVADPELNFADERDDNGGNLDPRPAVAGLAATGAPAPVDAGFDTVTYYGAFAPGNGADNPSWLTGWTAVDQQMLVDNLINSIGQVAVNGFLLDAPVPNPAYGTARINFELPVSAEVSISVIDMMGRPLSRKVNRFGAGEQSMNIDVANLPNGTYLVMLRAEGSQLLQKMIVRH